jgi:hypothetical protein
MDLDKSLPLAETAIDSEQEGNQRPEDGNTCLNCDSPLTGLYCANCGQKDLPKRQTIGELFINFVSSFWSFESKFLRTGKFLLLKPGRLAIDYTEGKRERYYHPARLYVFISFIFFLLTNVLPDSESGKEKDSDKYSIQNSEDFSVEQFDAVVGKFKSAEQYDSAQRMLPPGERDGFWMRKIREREIHINQRYKGKGKEFSAAFSDNYTGNVPKIFFFLLPVFALVLKLLYVRRDFFYSEHLVFSIYYYNFFFLTGSIYLLIEQVPFGSSVSWIIIIWMFIYLFQSMRKMYKQSWLKTLLKYGIFIFIFGFFVLLALTVNLAVTLMFL